MNRRTSQLLVAPRTDEMRVNVDEDGNTVYGSRRGGRAGREGIAVYLP